jgi:hypothetical protein
MQQLQSLGFEGGSQEVYAGKVSTRMGQTRDQTVTDWIVSHKSDDGNRGSCVFGRVSRGVTAASDNYGYPMLNQIDG